MNSSLPDIGDVATTQIGGLEIRLARGGRSDGIPILLTSPWPESIYAFRGIVPAIKELGPLILVDLPGFGRSRSRPDVMSPEAMGDFVIELAVHLGVDRMHAVGPDVGTSALLFAAARKPTLFESVVVGDGATSPELAGAGLKELIESPASAFASAEGGDIGAGFVTQSAAIKTPAAVLEDYRLCSAGRRFEEAAQYVRAYPRDLPRLKALLPSIETPVCSCWQERPDRSATERTAARGPLAPLPSHAPRWGASHLGGCCRGVLRSPRPMGPKRVPLGLTEESTRA